MPQVTVYVRESDIDLWKAIDKKSEFIHIALQETPIQQRAYHKSDQNDKRLQEELAGFTQSKIIKNPDQVLEQVKKTVVGNANLCKQHSTPLDARGRCMIKGCKYS